MAQDTSNYLIFDNQGTGYTLGLALAGENTTLPVVYLSLKGTELPGGTSLAFDYSVNFLPRDIISQAGDMFVSLPFAEFMVSYLGNILNQVRRSGAKPFIVAESLYGANKNLKDHHVDDILHLFHAAEEALLASNLPYAVIRPSLTYEFLLETFFDTESNVLSLPFADAAVAACSRKDVARLALALREDIPSCERKVFTLTGPRPVTGLQIATALSKHYQRNISYQPLTIEETNTLLFQMGYNAYQIDQYQRIFDECRMGWWGKYLATDFVKITKSEPLTFEKFLSLHK